VEPSGNGPLVITTSASDDWIVEYPGSEGNLITLEEQGGSVSPAIVINNTGSPQYFKVYPSRYSVTADISISATNADSIEVSGSVPEEFDQAQQPPPPQETQSPLPAGICIASAGTAGLCFHLSRRRP